MNTFTTQKTYSIVQPQEVKHKTEYYELSFSDKGKKQQFYFTTNAADLEKTAIKILQDKGFAGAKWNLIPHRKI